MTAPGMGLSSGTASWIKTFRDSQAAAAEIGKQLSIIEKVTAKDLRDAEYEMTVRNLLDDIHAQPLPEFHHAFLMA